MISPKQSGYEHSSCGVTFVPRPTVDAEDVILPEGTLDRMSQHVLGIAEHLERLLGDAEALSRVLLGARRSDADLPITMDDLVGGEDEWDDDLDD